MKKAILFTLFFCLGGNSFLYSSSSTFFDSYKSYYASEVRYTKLIKDQIGAETYFFENKGQIKQTDGKPAPYVKYGLQRGNADIYLLSNCGIAYQFSRLYYSDNFMKHEKKIHRNNEEDMQIRQSENEIRLETFRMDMHLLGADTNVRIVAEDKSKDYFQFYNHDALFVHHYKKIVYKNVYPQIDWVIYTSEEGGIKYDFVVHPGGDPSMIMIKFSSHEELFIDESGNLIHGNRLGQFVEKAPISFQHNKKIKSEFILKDNILSFAIADYDKNLQLVIDPNRIWATYYGGEGKDYGNSTAIDNSGNVYLAGSTFSTNGIASSGSHQSVSLGSSDAFLVKFSSNGERLWSTYYGGEENDQGWSVAVDNTGFVYLTGRSNSLTNISTNGCHQPILTNVPGGTFSDAFLVKFTGDGVRLWGTYYGGNDTDQGNSLAIDGAGFIYMAGYTLSPNNISTPGAFKTEYTSPSDGFVAKFSSAGVRQWGTYFGGSGYDFCTKIILNNLGNFYITGTTASPNLATPGAHQINNEGYHDAFIGKFSTDGERIWSTYYGGSKLEDVFNGLAIDASGNIYLCGVTYSVSNISTVGAHKVNKDPSSHDAFLVKFDSNGVRQWGTYYGGGSYDAAISLALDNNGFVYMAGLTDSYSDIATLGSYQNFIPIDSFGACGFLVKFTGNGLRQWATYYGGGGDDKINSLSLDNSGSLYFAGTTMSLEYVATPGAHQDFFPMEILMLIL
jgi:hypothetical protein